MWIIVVLYRLIRPRITLFVPTTVRGDKDYNITSFVMIHDV